MADRPGDKPPDTRPPDPTRVEAVAGEPSTVDAPARWSGSAVVPPPAPKRSKWAFRRAGVPEEEADDRESIPAVDPWEGQDTPWDPMPLPPEVLPPTRIEAPAPPPAPPPPAPAPAAKPPPPNRIPVGPRPQPRDPLPARYVPINLQQRPAPPMQRPPGAPPMQRPPGAPPMQRPGLPPPRKKRRRGRTLAKFALLSLVFCCGVPGFFLYPAAKQYPVSAQLPANVSDLGLRDDKASRRATTKLAEELGDAKAFAGIYGDGNGKKVTIFGTTGLRLTPEADLDAQISRLSSDYDLRDVRKFDVGESGVHEQCGVGKAGSNTVVVCAWADHGSLVTVLLTRRSVDDSADLTALLRDAVLQRG